MNSTAVTHERVYRRSIRRESRSSRSILAITVALIVVLGLAYAGAEIILAALGLGAIAIAPEDAVGAVVSITAAGAALVIATGVVVGLIGLALVITALRSGRLGRHHVSTDRLAVIVDDEVIGSALARRAAYAAATSPDNVRVAVSRRRAVADIVPTTGVPVDRDSALAAVRAELDTAAFAPALAADIRVSEKGRLNS